MSVYKTVTAYIWDDEGGPDVVIQKADWWDGSLIPIEGRKGNYIVVNPKYVGFREPDFEQLECGHEAEVKRGRDGRKGYANRRLCKQCADAAHFTASRRPAETARFRRRPSAQGS